MVCGLASTKVLSDPTKREQYDKYGRQSVEGNTVFADAKRHFAYMFGGLRFKSYIGASLHPLNSSDGGGADGCCTHSIALNWHSFVLSADTLNSRSGYQS